MPIASLQSPFNPDSDGVIRSRTFPGLWLPVSHLLSGDMTQVLLVLQSGLNSPEHQDFVQRLQTS